MLEITDIQERIKLDFGDDSETVFDCLKEAVARAEYLNHGRIIRCIIFLADRDIKRFRELLNSAIEDPRDVMYWAEYENRNTKSPTRVRDFNNTFKEARINSSEIY